MSRSSKKGPFFSPKLLKRILRQKDEHSHEPIKTWARSCTILPEFVSHTFMVHNGKAFQKVFVTEDMVGHKLGEFAPTRFFRGHSGIKKAETEGGEATS
jgi:small subunit ribosomal protein S19